MNLWFFSLVIISGFLSDADGYLFMSPPGMLPFMAYFTSYYRGVCVAVMINRMAALTAAVCVANPIDIDFQTKYDTRPINLILGSTYRHPRRGIKVQVTKLILPKMPNDAQRSYLIQTSVAILLLKSKVPDALTEFPVRPALLDRTGVNNPVYHEECLVAGWHFFERETDIIYPIQKFLLQRNLRGQFVDTVKSDHWCPALMAKFNQALKDLHDTAEVNSRDLFCTKDPDDEAQPCHGMFGGPLICRGNIIGMLTVPDGQWTNCTGATNLYTRLDNNFLKPFFECTEPLFEYGEYLDLEVIKKKVYKMPEDQQDAQYDKVVINSDASSSDDD